MKYAVRKIIFFLIILIPFWSFLVWFFWPKTTFNGLILDKTVLNRQGNEHRSLNWVLTHEKLVKPNGSQYSIQDDYFGFFPIDRPEYVVKDLTVFNNPQIDSVARNLEFLFYTDAYGIYTNEWVYGRDINERSRLVYGGLSNPAYDLFREMYQNRKLTITEFNNLASPTPLNLRFKMSRVLEVDFTGWTGRYYHSLDTVKNPDIPRWMRRLHLKYYGKPFDYPDIPGIVLIHESERIAVLQDGIDLEYEVPIIYTPDSMQERFDLPDLVRFPYWFDITYAKDTTDIYARYKIHTKERGDSILGSHHLTNIFPAMIGDSKEDLRYYFCGDWSDNPVPFGLAYFKGARYLRKFFYNNQDNLDRKKFFWEYYVPLVTTIFDEYRQREDTVTTTRSLPSNYPNYIPYYRKYNYPLPDIGAIASGRRYDSLEILGTQYIPEVYRDSIRQAELKEARETGYYIGEYGDTVYVDEKPADKREETDRDTTEASAESTKAKPSPTKANSGAKEVEPKNNLERKDTVSKNQQSSVTTTTKSPNKDNGYFGPEGRFQVGGRLPLNSFARTQVPKPAPKIDNTSAKGNRAKTKGGTSVGPSADEPGEETYEKQEKPTKKTTDQTQAENWRTKNYPYVTNFDLEDKYRVVIASFKNREEAEERLVRLNDVEALLVYMPKYDVHRLVYRSYDNLPAARSTLENIAGRYPKAWIVYF